MTRLGTAASAALKRLGMAYSARARARRARLFRTAMSLSDDDRVLDLGSEDGSHVAALLPGRRNVWIADIDPVLLARGRERYGFETVLLDESGRLPLEDDAFDCVFCSSVLEHVTVDKSRLYAYSSNAEFARDAFQRQRRLAEEIRRVAKKYFVQTPNRWFLIESHTWLPMPVTLLPRPAFVRLIASMNRWWPKRTAPDFHLLTAAQMQELFPDAEIIRERSLGMTKSLIAVRRCASGADS